MLRRYPQTRVSPFLPPPQRPWALPVLFRLYRTKKDCARRQQRTTHRKRSGALHRPGARKQLVGAEGGVPREGALVEDPEP